MTQKLWIKDGKNFYMKEPKIYNKAMILKKAEKWEKAIKIT